MKRHMIVEIDHMSAKAADETIDILENAQYSGVISSHSWTDEHYMGRIYGLGGMAVNCSNAADQFVAEWQRKKQSRDPRYTFGYGYGLDANGMGALPPRARTIPRTRCTTRSRPHQRRHARPGTHR